MVQVAALEVQNVRKAIHRYGTLPKGVRIGAYLESLKQSGMNEGGASSPPPPPNETPPCQRSPRSRVAAQQPGQMIRSNSSGGFQHHPVSPRTGRLHRSHHQTPPSLADLEFPPPPPPEELDPVPSRFGISLRKREPSTDSTSSAKSEPRSRPKEKTSSPPPSPPPPPPSSNSPPTPIKEMELKLADKSPPNTDTNTSPVDFKANLRKVSQNLENGVKQDPAFKNPLKKFEPKTTDSNRDEDKNNGIAELKSKLRKVNESSTPKGNTEEDDDSDDKRRSTGSISSLKKLWEGESSPPEIIKERRVWPPDEKPAVPTKPSVKPKIPNIYATPGIQTSVLEISQALESSIVMLKSATNVTSASWLQLSDKIGLFHTTCLDHAESVAPPHIRFHLRELLNKLEMLGGLLRSAGTRNMTENRKTLDELQNTLKDIVNSHSTINR